MGPKFRSLLFICLPVSVFVFAIVTLLTSTNESASDGYNLYGYPLIFSASTNGKCTSCEREGFNLLFLILDFLIIVVSVLLLQVLYLMFISKKK